MASKTRALVAGGGYAGVQAANRLRRDEQIDITLINPRSSFVERIRLHQLVTGSDDAAVDYDEVLGQGITRAVDSVTTIDASARRVDLASGVALDYDYLIYAVGSTGSAPSVPGAADFAHSIAELEHAERLRAALMASPIDAPICVIGAGATGLETAAELAEQGRRVTLLCGRVLGPSLSTRGRRAVVKRMISLGVDVIDGPDATVVEVLADAVVLADERQLASAVTIWTAGFGVPDLAARSGLRTDAAGRLLTDETLTSLDDDRIVAAGDASAPSGQPLRMSCQAAIPLGAQAAETVLSRIAGTAPKPIDQAFVGQCISLGRSAGLIQLAHRDDRVMPLHAGGRAAARIKEAVCRSTVSYLTREARKPGSYRWLKGGLRERTPAVDAVSS
ncbi:NAD(P)/FAD-dependent oxidoreductase [Aeromicrobium wangtongii]|uniref:NAD(P)/FAD-dependent oxidoreductase n=1 Tax=Aeromicrobium wangtongii TaxID=2969247 RepID=UPI002017D8BD|nr:FAD-dependent oxidoreductase [Aeromicrobium wangtongii]MCL3819563.1 FAD-dependent oxidoreductase [Aeromicrobium wangtongii]